IVFTVLVPPVKIRPLVKTPVLPAPPPLRWTVMSDAVKVPPAMRIVPPSLLSVRIPPLNAADPLVTMNDEPLLPVVAPCTVDRPLTVSEPPLTSSADAGDVLANRLTLTDPVETTAPPEKVTVLGPFLLIDPVPLIELAMLTLSLRLKISAPLLTTAP